MTTQPPPGDWPSFRHDPELSGHQPLAGVIQHPAVIARYPIRGPVFHAEPFVLRGEPLLLMLWGGVLHCLRLDGTLRWKSPPMGFEGVVAVDDLDNDGRVEIALTNGRTIAVLDAESGAVLWQEYLGPPYSAGFMPTGALVHHFPQIGHGKQLAIGLLSSKEVLLYDFTPGASNPRRLHTLWMDDFFHPTLLACDVDGDGRDELVVTKYAAIYTFDPLTGAQKSACHWSSGGSAKRNYGLFVARELCGTGRLDFAVLSNRVSKHLAVVSNNGRGELSIAWDRFIEHIYPTDHQELRYSFNSCADLDGDRQMEIVVSTFNALGDGAWHLEILDARSGAVRLDCKGLMLHGVQKNSRGEWMMLASHQTERQPMEFATIGAYCYDGRGLRMVWELGEGAFLGRFCGHDSTTSVFRSELPPEDEVWAVPVDGLLTVPILGKDGTLRLFQEHRDGWKWHATFAAGNVAALLLCQDLDGDQRTELLLSCWDGTCQMLRADGTIASSWQTGLRLRPGTGPYYLSRPMQTPTVASIGGEYFCAVPDGGNSIHLLKWSCEAEGLVANSVLAGRGRIGPEETFHSADFITQNNRLLLPLSTIGQGHSALLLHEVGGNAPTGPSGNPACIFCDEFPASPPLPPGRIGLSEFAFVEAGNRKFWILSGYASASMNSERTLAVEASPPHTLLWQRELIGEGEEGRGFGPWSALSVAEKRDGRTSLLFLAKDTVCEVDAATGRFLVPPWQLRQHNTAQMNRRGLTMDDFAAYGALVPCDVDGDGVQEYLVAGAYGGVGVINADHTMRWWIAAPLSSLCGSFPGIADVDGDRLPELGLSYANGDFVCLRASDGLEKWRVHLGSQATGVITCDSDGDGCPEFLLATQGGELVAVGVASNGVGIVRWRMKFGYTLGQPIAADINGDGKSEVILVSGEGEVIVVGAG